MVSMKKNNNLLNILILVCSIVGVLSLTMMFVPAIGYKTLATNNVYSFSLWDFVMALIDPISSEEIIIFNYMQTSLTSACAYAISIFSIIAFVLIIALVICLVVANYGSIKISFFTSIALLLNMIGLFVSVCVFTSFITNQKGGITIDSIGYVMWGFILLTIFVVTIFTALAIKYFYKGKNKWAVVSCVHANVE